MSDPHEPYSIDLLAPDEAYCPWCEEVVANREMVSLMVAGEWVERCGACVESEKNNG